MAETAAGDVNPSSDPKAALDDLKAKATHQYSLKKYSEASDLYAQATELQASINGDMSPQNAELLYLYGKSLYQVGISQNDVLGGNVAGDAPNADKDKSIKLKKEAPKLEPVPGQHRIAEEGVAKIADGKDGVKDETIAPKPFFQFTGDENFDDSDADEGDEAQYGEEEGEAEEEEEEDDLAAAWTMLDMARVLFAVQLEELSVSDKGKSTELSPDQRHVKERLADTHDLLAEISLEGEKFPEAATDFRSSLDMRLELYPADSPLIGEGWYKLSLALEFASTTTTAEAQDAQLDEGLRKEAVEAMENALSSTQMRIESEEKLLAAGNKAELEKSKISRNSIDELKEMVVDMKQRSKDLKAAPVSLNSILGGPAEPATDGNVLNGILGSVLGETPLQQKERIDQAAKNATDLTGLVRRKKPESAVKSTNGNAKRKTDEVGEEKIATSSKKARVGEDEK
ncbi:MAG: hypothetical protein M1814_004722 [Vezdaea aestivalis]|nr:MAG: hypothetical protein M1814_004722 [Vezdaea aestivalis]